MIKVTNIYLDYCYFAIKLITLINYSRHPMNVCNTLYNNRSQLNVTVYRCTNVILYVFMNKFNDLHNYRPNSVNLFVL